MVKELDMQRALIQAAREGGGWARKWASDSQVGMPDLIIKVPEFAVVFMEVKYHRGKFVRGWKIPITSRQRSELVHWHNAGAHATIGVIEDGGSRDRWLWLCNPWSTHIGGKTVLGNVTRRQMPYGGPTDLRGVFVEHFSKHWRRTDENTDF